MALEHYFRNPGPLTGTAANAGFRYSINVPPNERDSGLSDWLLDANSPGYHTGYCEQFSASMGVLARLLDIPTRTVLGFTPGEVRADGTILVRDRNAHAWVEVWLPAQGWVRFDPTPRGDRVNPTTFERTGFTSGDLDRYFDTLEQQALEAAGVAGGTAGSPFRDPDAINPDIFVGEGGDSETGGGFSLPSWTVPTVLWGLFGIGALSLVPAIKRRRRKRRLRRVKDGDIGAAWAEIVDRLIDSGISMSSADTPLEVAVSTDSAMQPLAEVYSESVYGDRASLPEGSRATATDSLTATEQRLRSRESRWQRIRRTYRVRSLLPDWVKRAASRRR